MTDAEYIHELEELVEEAAGWLADFLAADGTRDGDRPTMAQLERWADDWQARAGKVGDR